MLQPSASTIILQVCPLVTLLSGRKIAIGVSGDDSVRIRALDVWEERVGRRHIGKGRFGRCVRRPALSKHHNFAELPSRGEVVGPERGITVPRNRASAVQGLYGFVEVVGGVYIGEWGYIILCQAHRVLKTARQTNGPDVARRRRSHTKQVVRPGFGLSSSRCIRRARTFTPASTRRARSSASPDSRSDPNKLTEVLRIPADRGATPVGLVPGPDGNVWFVLLGGSGGGTGAFGRIGEGGAIEYFQLKVGAAMGASLIHLGFSPDAGQQGAPERIFVLGSSMAAMMALNAVFEVGMSGHYARIESQQTIAFPSQSSMSHRVLPTSHGVYATELGAGAIVHLIAARRAGGEQIDERSDAYALWGCGVPASSVEY